MPPVERKRPSRLSRRQLLGGAGMVGAGASSRHGRCPPRWPKHPLRPPRRPRTSASLYQSLGVRPFINCRGTLTVLGGNIELPEVRAAKAAANEQHAQLDELMAAIGKRLAELTGAEWGMVSAGCAAAMSLATAACIAGGNPDLHVRIPNLEASRRTRSLSQATPATSTTPPSVPPASASSKPRLPKSWNVPSGRGRR